MSEHTKAPNATSSKTKGTFQKREWKCHKVKDTVSQEGRRQGLGGKKSEGEEGDECNGCGLNTRTTLSEVKIHPPNSITCSKYMVYGEMHITHLF